VNCLHKEKKDSSTPDEMKPSDESLETGADNQGVEISEVNELFCLYVDAS